VYDPGALLGLLGGVLANLNERLDHVVKRIHFVVEYNQISEFVCEDFFFFEDFNVGARKHLHNCTGIGGMLNYKKSPFSSTTKITNLGSLT
jgi:hypothetical protein